MWKHFKKHFIGAPIPNWEHKHQRLPKRIALAVFSSDALSSVAYATEEILLVLLLAGSAAMFYSIHIAIAIIVLLSILIISYYQTIKAYAKGGGSYIVSKENLGTNPSLVAASALLIDYILTAAVSVAAGIAAVTSAFPGIYGVRVFLGVLVLFLIIIINLRGVRESGIIFAIPTYLFIVSFLAMISVGFYKYFAGTLTPVMVQTQIGIVGAVSIFLILRAFASGCTALTGIEAISDGVMAFREPESRNAQKTLVAMGIILAVLFFGITFLAFKIGIIPAHDRTVVSLIAENLFGKTWLFFVVQTATMLILFLAANTAFADFPRLCYFLAKDRYLPRQFLNLGSRMVFSNGIMLLGVFASLLIIAFEGSVHKLIPLYAVGVFTSFTLSQAGMINYHFRTKHLGWKVSAGINMVGALTTAVVLVVILMSKFVHGAWIVVILIILLVLFFQRIHTHYDHVSEQLSADLSNVHLKRKKHFFVIMVPSVHKGILHALDYANSLKGNIVAVHVNLNSEITTKLHEDWKKLPTKIKLVVLGAPYREMINPLLGYIDHLREKNPESYITVIIPEFVPKKPWHNLIHNQTGLLLKTAIHFKKNVDYISVQYHLEE